MGWAVACHRNPLTRQPPRPVGRAPPHPLRRGRAVVVRSDPPRRRQDVAVHATPVGPWRRCRCLALRDGGPRRRGVFGRGAAGCCHPRPPAKTVSGRTTARRLQPLSSACRPAQASRPWAKIGAAERGSRRPARRRGRRSVLWRALSRARFSVRLSPATTAELPSWRRQPRTRDQKEAARPMGRAEDENKGAGGRYVTMASG